MNWRRRSSEQELLDRDDLPFADLLQNLKELDRINTLLGGHRATLAGLQAFLTAANGRPLHIAEIGCGGGDNLRVVHRFLKARGIPHTLTGVDLKPECIRYAREAQDPDAVIDWQCCDYRDTAWTTPPDVIFSSLFCHHFSDAALVEQLQWLQKQARVGFFINDLHRHPVAYHSIRFLTRLFSRSYLVRNDAPVSVQRGFQRAEWLELARRADLRLPVLRWCWAFRYLLIWKRRA